MNVVYAVVMDTLIIVGSVIQTLVMIVNKIVREYGEAVRLLMIAESVVEIILPVQIVMEM